MTRPMTPAEELDAIAGQARDMGNALDDLGLPELAAHAEAIADAAEALLDPQQRERGDDL